MVGVVVEVPQPLLQSGAAGAKTSGVGVKVTLPGKLGRIAGVLKIKLYAIHTIAPKTAAPPPYPNNPFDQSRFLDEQVPGEEFRFY